LNSALFSPCRPVGPHLETARLKIAPVHRIVFGIVLICVLIGDLCLVVMDDVEDVVCIEAPVPSNACTPRPVARNGGAVRVRFNGEGSKSASSPVRPGKFKKQRRADREYVRPKEWKVVRRYATGGRAQLDVEDIDFAIYKKARELMESSGIILAHEHVRRDEFYLSTYLLLSIYMSMHLIYVLNLPQFKVFI
jgi:hypothetical protein